MNDTWGRRLFKGGAFVLILLGMAHSLSLFSPMTPSNETERQLLSLMSNYRFDLAGSQRTVDNLLRGFSLCFILGAIGLGVLDLSLARGRVEQLKRAALINVLWLAALTAVSLRYFFVVPTAFLLVALLLFVLAWFKLPASAS